MQQQFHPPAGTSASELPTMPTDRMESRQAHVHDVDVHVPWTSEWELSSIPTDTVPHDVLRAQLTDLEAANMAGYPRNGAAFVRYFTRVDLVLHTITCGAVLQGFAIVGSGFLYELHSARCRCGIGRAHLRRILTGLASRRPFLRVHVHTAGEAALAIYKAMGCMPFEDPELALVPHMQGMVCVRAAPEAVDAWAL